MTIVTITNLNHDCDRCDLPGRRPARRYRNAGPVTSLGLVARDLILLRRPGTVTPWARVRRHESLRLAETSIEPRPVPGPGGRLAARRSSQCAAARTVTVPRTGSLAHWHVTVTVTRRVRKCHWHCDSDFHRLGVTAAAGRAAVTVTVTALPSPRQWQRPNFHYYCDAARLTVSEHRDWQPASASEHSVTCNLPVDSEAGPWVTVTSIRICFLISPSC